MARARTAGEHPGRRDKSLTVPVPRENTYLPRAGITASGSRSMTVSRTRAARSGTRRPCSHSLVGMLPAGRPSETGLAESAGNGQGVVGSC